MRRRDRLFVAWGFSIIVALVVAICLVNFTKAYVGYKTRHEAEVSQEEESPVFYMSRVTYTVKPGDTLSELALSIAEECNAKGASFTCAKTLEIIYSLNESIDLRGRTLRAGERITLPEWKVSYR